MTRPVLFLSLVAFLGGCSAFHAPVAPGSSTAATVRVRARYGWCGGVYVAPDQVLTAKHCAGPETIVCDSLNRCTYAYRFEERDDDGQDLALYRVRLRGSPVRVRINIRWGETLTTIHHVGTPYSVQPGEVTAIHGGWNGYELGFAGLHGMSGSPAFHSDGTLACIVTSAYTDGKSVWCQGFEP